MYMIKMHVEYGHSNKNNVSHWRVNNSSMHVHYHDALQYIPRNMHTVFALLCFVVVIHWLIFPYPSGSLHWHCCNLTIAPVPAKQPWWIWINTSCEFIMNDCVTTTKPSTTKPCAYFLGYTVRPMEYAHSLHFVVVWSRLVLPTSCSTHKPNKTKHHKTMCLLQGTYSMGAVLFICPHDGLRWKINKFYSRYFHNFWEDDIFYRFRITVRDILIAVMATALIWYQVI